MKDAIEIVMFGLFGVWIIVIPSIMIMKIKYFKTLRHKEFRGTTELFSFFSSEFWIAGITWGFPIIGQERNLELNTIRKKANSRLYILYLTVMTQVILVGLIQKYV